jgi:hypothetical protein
LKPPEPKLVCHREDPLLQIIESSSDFDAVRKGGRAVVCFHSPHSAYSRRTLQVLRELEPQFPSFKFGVVDVDCPTTNPLLPEFNIYGIPATCVFGSDAKVFRYVGELRTKAALKLLARHCV